MPRAQRVDNREVANRPRVVHSQAHRVAHRVRRLDAGRPTPPQQRSGAGRRGRERGCAHRRIIASIAWISDRSEASSLTRSMIFWTAEMTVVWCLPPNARARSGYESLVWWREMYIATARGVATD